MPNLAAAEKKLILTFGYGNRKDYDAFLDYLEEFNVTCVVDVRLSPRAWSRKWYGTSLEKLFASKNIQYISKVSLGNISGCEHWIPPEQKEAEQTLFEVAKIIETGNVLLLCAEIDSSRCHRVEVASKLQDLTSASVKHLK
ncbi:MAG: DUF488 domain-containing protein [Leptolyngbya sp.]|nr:MAG: DUF488 domain-containing protein [Leptolyngbya sp.]